MGPEGGAGEELWAQVQRPASGQGAGGSSRAMAMAATSSQAADISGRCLRAPFSLEYAQKPTGGTRLE